MSYVLVPVKRKPCCTGCASGHGCAGALGDTPPVRAPIGADPCISGKSSAINTWMRCGDGRLHWVDANGNILAVGAAGAPTSNVNVYDTTERPPKGSTQTLTEAQFKAKYPKSYDDWVRYQNWPGGLKGTASSPGTGRTSMVAFGQAPFRIEDHYWYMYDRRNGKLWSFVPTSLIEDIASEVGDFIRWVQSLSCAVLNSGVADTEAAKAGMAARPDVAAAVAAGKAICGGRGGGPSGGGGPPPTEDGISPVILLGGVGLLAYLLLG